MQKLKIFLILLLFSILGQAQNHRFIYEYSYKMDSLNRENIDKELMILDVTASGSKFYSKEKVIYDSLVEAKFKQAEMIKSSNINLSSIKNKSKVEYSVSKTYPDLKAIFHTKVDGSRYAVNDSKKMDWKILPDKMDIQGLSTQKAVTNYGGRKWTAWFTPEIQVQDGPYKFSGLPGLILRLEDDKADHVYQFVGSQKLAVLPNLTADEDEPEIEISPAQFTKVWKAYLQDPAKKIREMLMRSDTTIKVTDASGKEPSQAEIIRNREQRAKEKMKKINNFPELDLYR